MLEIPTREHYKRAYRAMRIEGVNHTLFMDIILNDYDIPIGIIEAAHKSWQAARQLPPPNFHQVRCRVHFRREFNRLIEIG